MACLPMQNISVPQSSSLIEALGIEKLALQRSKKPLVQNFGMPTSLAQKISSYGTIEKIHIAKNHIY
jgi:hypothetical protein